MNNQRTGKEELYNIVRFYSQEGKRSKIVRKGVTLEEAREHCSRLETRKVGVYFDGYTRE